MLAGGYCPRSRSRSSSWRAGSRPLATPIAVVTVVAVVVVVAAVAVVAVVAAVAADAAVTAVAVVAVAAVVAVVAAVAVVAVVAAGCSSRCRRCSRVSTAIGGVAEQVWYEWLLAFRARTKPVPQSSDVQVVLPLPSAP